ncbi:MAG: endonuclease/exonuclease/phosphatase family protein [Chitinophagaceae bacterium]
MLRLTFLLSVSFLLTNLTVNAQPVGTDTTLDIVNWNIEWLGSTTNGPADKNKQEQNALTVLRYLNADLYALCEIVDTAALGRITRSLGPQYRFIVSDYCSLAGSPLDADWRTGQKLAFLYNSNIFSNVVTRGMLRNSGAAYTNFASGRYPFLFNANATVNGQKRNITCIVIHAKSGATISDWNRRFAAANELKDTIDQQLANKSWLVVGDYNDDLDVSIVTGQPSSYVTWLNDANRFFAITLPESLAGKRSTIGFNDVIDHQVASKAMDSMFISGSATVRTDVVNVIPDYNTRNTSDHYPVFSSYKLSNGDTSLAPIVNPNPPTPPVVTPTALQVQLINNPITNNELVLKANQSVTNVQLALFNSNSTQIWQVSNTVLSNGTNGFTLPQLPNGAYFLRIQTPQQLLQFKILKL